MGVIQFEDLQNRIVSGGVKTVICGLPDIWGRVMGKRLTGKSFVDCVTGGEGIHASTYLFCSDMEMEPRPGYKLTGWDKGFQDFMMTPDLGTIRVLPWLKETAFVLCDAVDEATGELLPIAPRSILKRQLERAGALGVSLKCATELEFFTFQDSFKSAWDNRYRDLTPTSHYRSDYHILQSTRDEEFVGELRELLIQAGIEVENAKTEWGLGQQEIALRYCEALEMADSHVMYKLWVKEILGARGLSATFMAKPFIEEVGSSCHVHMSLWDAESGKPMSYDAHADTKMSATFAAFVAGMMKDAGEYTWMFAPSVNSYKRFQAESFAPVSIVLGEDNRTCGFRLVGHGKGFRVESRIPGADANPYLTLAAMIASGLDGVDQKLPAPEIYSENAYENESLPRVPDTMRKAITAFSKSERAKVALGESVHAHLLHFAEDELDSFERWTVTDWELMRYFERV